MEAPRAETTLSAREKRHMAGLLERITAGWDGMQQRSPAERRRAQDLYDQALAAFLREWDAHQNPRYWQSGSIFTAGQKTFKIEFATQTKSQREVAPSQIDQLLLASRVSTHPSQKPA